MGLSEFGPWPKIIPSIQLRLIMSSWQLARQAYCPPLLTTVDSISGTIMCIWIHYTGALHSIFGKFTDKKPTDRLNNYFFVKYGRLLQAYSINPNV